MEKLKEQIRKLQDSAKNVDEFDIMIKTGDENGDGYAFVFVDDNGLYDVSYLQDRIPADAWCTPEGRDRIQAIMDEGKQYWSKENSLFKAVKEVFAFWCATEKDVKLVNYEVTSERSARLVLSLN